MKNVLIILGATAALFVAGFAATAEAIRRHQIAANPEPEHSLGAEDTKARQETQAWVARAMSDAAERQEWGLVGGGIGAGVGFVLGLIWAFLRDRKRRRTPPPGAHAPSSCPQ